MVDAVNRSVVLGIAVEDRVGILPRAVEAHVLHPIDLGESFPGLGRDHPHTGGDLAPAHVVDIAVLVQLHRHHVVACADEVFLDLLMGALDGGDDGDDGGDADDDAQHGEHGAHFVPPDALKGQANIFTHSVSS